MGLFRLAFLVWISCALTEKFGNAIATEPAAAVLINALRLVIWIDLIGLKYNK
jgi:hypothetical protein